MGYGWQDQSEGAAKMPAGKHRLRISKIEFADNDGNALTSKGNDPQIKVHFQNKLGQEVPQYYTLSEKAGWTLAKLLSCFDPPANLKKMEEAGIEPKHFANKEFCENQLLNRELWAEVGHQKGTDGKEYARVDPIKPEPANQPSVPSMDAPPPAPSLPAMDAPPAAPEAPPVQWTRESAWAAVVSGWSGAVATNGDEAKKRRDGAWLEGIRKVGKPESQFTSMDWAIVVQGATIPF